MNDILSIHLSVFSLLLAFFMLINIHDKREKERLDYKLFLTMLGATITVIILFTSVLFLEGTTFIIGKIILLVSVTILHTLGSFISMIYAVYVENVTFRKVRKSKYWIFFYSIPAFLVFCLAVASFFTGWFFSIDEQNNYAFGPIYYVPIMVPLWYLVYAVFVLLNRRKQSSTREFNRLILFPIPILIGGSFQAIFQNYLLFIPAYILSLFTLYSSIQERRLSSDHLTGAFNRQRLDSFLEAMISAARNSGGQFSALLADVNSFKHINDTFGHKEGDRALITVVDTIKKNIRRNDFLARYAGDEFVVIFPKCNESVLDEIVSRIRDGFSSLPSQGQGYSLSLSIGSSVFNPEKDMCQDDYIVRLDKLMYENKKEYKELDSFNKKSTSEEVL